MTARPRRLAVRYIGQIFIEQRRDDLAGDEARAGDHRRGRAPVRTKGPLYILPNEWLGGHHLVFKLHPSSPATFPWTSRIRMGLQCPSVVEPALSRHLVCSGSYPLPCAIPSDGSCTAPRDEAAGPRRRAKGTVHIGIATGSRSLAMRSVCQPVSRAILF